MLGSPDARVRSYGVRALSGWADRLEVSEDWLKKMAEDPHPRVRLEAVVACSYLRRPASIAVALKVLDHSRDRFIDYALRQTARSLQPIWEPVLREGQLALERPEHQAYLRALTTEEPVTLSQGELLYQKACLPCHQADGKGLPGFYPSLESSDWVSGDPGRLIRIVLHGLEGPITLNGEAFLSKTPIAMPGLPVWAMRKSLNCFPTCEVTLAIRPRRFQVPRFKRFVWKKPSVRLPGKSPACDDREASFRGVV